MIAPHNAGMLFLNGKHLHFCKRVLILAFILGSNGLQAQVSGLWDANGVTGTSGYVNKGNGVIELIDAVLNGCQGGAVHETSVTYDPSTNFSKCYQVFFGCPAPGNDNIGGPDIKGDGLAFCFWKNSATFNENNGVYGSCL
jgi:hypothetical protein